ncbi:short-subunit dehydrogenase [Rhodoblastus acidophilus]|nr:short-subunit dehydrogenase [Rhodoblastus acidophilus]
MAAEHAIVVDVIRTDLTARDDLRRIEDRIRADSAVTLLVNNAGMGTPRPVLQESIDFLEHDVIGLNVVAAHRLSIAAAQVFAERRRGGLINIASIAALHPEKTNATYAATKAFILTLSESLHATLKPLGVRVQCVLPGATRTEFFDRLGIALDTRFPADKVMSAEDLVDAALAGYDQGEIVTAPSLPELADWDRYIASRHALDPNLSHRKPAARYGLIRADD